MFLTSKALAAVPGIRHGFGSRNEPIPKPLLEAWNSSHPDWRQVHGVGIAEVLAPNQSCGEVDALFSRSSQAPIAVVTADCVPILMARPGAVAAVHAGWRGTFARILPELWDKLSKQGENPRDWVAAVGPAIGPCCYQVSAEIADQFSSLFSSMDSKMVVPSTRHLDLPAINAEELRRIGVGKVDLLRACTRCSGTDQNPDYFSYRREGKGTRQWSMLMID